MHKTLSQVIDWSLTFSSKSFFAYSMAMHEVFQDLGQIEAAFLRLRLKAIFCWMEGGKYVKLAPYPSVLAPHEKAVLYSFEFVSPPCGTQLEAAFTFDTITCLSSQYGRASWPACLGIPAPHWALRLGVFASCQSSITISCLGSHISLWQYFRLKAFQLCK